MKTLRPTILVILVLCSVLIIQPLPSVHAAATGSLNTLTFPGASATNCGSWLVSGSITVTAPGNWSYTVTDGNGTVVRSGTFTTTGTYSGLLANFSPQPAKNPIRVVVVIDGTTVANVVGDNPCLPPSSTGGDGGVKFYDPGDDRLNREPGQPAALYCRNQGDVHIYAVNTDDSKGKIALVVTKAEIDAVINGNPAANTLIKQSADGKFKLFYLPATKELSFITNEARSGKQYSFVWKGLCR